MTRNKACTTKGINWRMHVISTRLFIIFLFVLPLMPGTISAQDESGYDEILVFLNVRSVGGIEIPALIKDQELYLPVSDLFDFLRIRNIPSEGLDSISGFFINKDASYYINRVKNRIIYQEKLFKLKPGDLIRTESNLYLKTEYFGIIFGLDCSFNFRELSVTLTSKLELPVIREMRIEEMRKNLNKVKGEMKSDMTIGPQRQLFKVGMADWGIYSNEEIGGKSNATMNLSLGAMLAGGELTGSLYYNTLDKFSEKQQNYLWRYVNNDFAPLRQFMAGKISPHATSTLYNPVIGVQFTNTPTTFRKSFGTYKINDYTEPGWIVELYINNVLVDYVKSDASGFFSFDVPLVYGNSSVILKYYGPWGEEKTKEQNINIPYNFLPEKTFEYNIGAGIVEDSLASRFSRASLSYGVTKNITVGGGIEYLSSVTSGPFMPFLNSSFRITNNILLSGEYTYGVRAKGTLLYRLPSNIQVDLNYTWYQKGQTAINFNYREERKASVSVPLRIARMQTFQRFSMSQILLPSARYEVGEWLFSGQFFRVNTNLTTYAYLSQFADPYVYSSLALAYRLPANFTIMPQLQWRYTKNSIVSSKLRIEKSFNGKAYLYLQGERFFRSNLNLAELGFKYDFSFAQAGASFRRNAGRTSLIQYARGSLIADPGTKFITGDNRTNVGRGGITVIPFIDQNSNGKRDPGEPKVSGLNLRTNGGRIIKHESDTTIRITGMEPFTTCFIELDQNSFENISWKLGIKNIGVYIDPEILKTVEIPVMVMGEASGAVSLEKEGTKTGLGRIIISFCDVDGKTVARSLTEEGGFYSYLGFKPGHFIARPDTSQLRRLQYISVPEFLEFDIKSGKDGDFVEGLNFTLKKSQEEVKEKPPVAEEPVKPVVKRDTAIMVIHEMTQELVTIGEDSYAIQLGAFKKKSNAEAYKKTLERLLGRKVDVVVEQDFFKVRINGLKDRSEVDKTIAILKKNGVTELWVIALKAKQKQWVLVERRDTIRQITETIEGKPPTIISPERVIQVGAFEKEENAVALRDRLSTIVEYPAVIVHEGSYYKVQVTGLTDLKEFEKVLNYLGLVGLKDLWVPPVKNAKALEPPVQTKPVAPPVEVKPVVPPADTAKKETPVPKPQPPVVTQQVKEPPISIHVAAFYKKSQALRAVRRISSKLNLQAEIIQQWDYYHVVIPGFNTREETFRYYPELAGIGYPNITLIEKK